MATRTTGSDKQSRTKSVAFLVLIAIMALVLAGQVRSRSRTSNSHAQLRPAIVLNELPTGPQHGQGPHPFKIDHLAQPSADG